MRVLVIEDDLALASFLKRGLEQEGHAVTHALNGELGIAKAVESGADLIVLDLNLPRVDGKEVLKQIRAGGVLTPVLVLTGRGSVEERIACLDAGADDFLAKPFSFFELAARCRAVMRRGAATEEASRVQHGPLLVDRLSRTVYLHNKEVALTAKEFALLDYLLQNRDRAVGRPELLEKVWRMAPDSGTNVVDVYVNYLRRKLRSDDLAGDLIVTVRGSGYALAPAATPVTLPLKKPAGPTNLGLLGPGMQNPPAVAA